MFRVKRCFAMRDPLLETSGKIAAFYEREFYCFSNFSSFAVVWRGRRWPTSGHAYQAAKFLDRDSYVAFEILDARSAHKALQIARRYKHLVPLEWWVPKRIPVMEDICSHKLYQHSYISEKLLETGNMRIVEDSPTDSFWGWGPDRNGSNELGKIWMRLRERMFGIKMPA